MKYKKMLVYGPTLTLIFLIFGVREKGKLDTPKKGNIFLFCFKRYSEILNFSLVRKKRRYLERFQDLRISVVNNK